MSSEIVAMRNVSFKTSIGYTALLALFPLLALISILFLLILGMFTAPLCLVYLLCVTGREELDIFSFPAIVQSVAEDIAVLLGIGQETTPERPDPIDFPNPVQARAIYPRCSSFISDFSETDDVYINRERPRRKSRLFGPEIDLRMSTISNNPNVWVGNSNPPKAACGHYEIQNYFFDGNIATLKNTIVSIKEAPKTPQQKPFDLSRRIISPHWSTTKSREKEDLITPLISREHSPSQLLWPSPVSDTSSGFVNRDSIFTSLKAGSDCVPKRMERAEEIFGAPETAIHSPENTRDILRFQQKVFGAQPSETSSDGFLPGAPLRIERKLFVTNPGDDDSFSSVSSSPLASIQQDSHQAQLFSSPSNFSVPSDQRAFVEYVPTIGSKEEHAAKRGSWAKRYKNLMSELEGSIKTPMENDKKECIDEKLSHEVAGNASRDSSCVGLTCHSGSVNYLNPENGSLLAKNIGIKADELEESAESKDVPSIVISSPTPSPEAQEAVHPHHHQAEEEGNTDYWIGFDQTYEIQAENLFNSPKSDDEDNNWRIEVDKWADKGVKVLKPVNEEIWETGETGDNGDVQISSDMEKAVHQVDQTQSLNASGGWVEPSSTPRDGFHNSFIAEFCNENNMHGSHIELPKGPAPLSENRKALTPINKENTLHEQTTNSPSIRFQLKGLPIQKTLSPLVLPGPLSKTLLDMLDDLGLRAEPNKDSPEFGGGLVANDVKFRDRL